MSKSDLIDKINARVKSQLSTLTPRVATRPRGDEPDERSQGPGDKRITNSRTGTVVVRRRTAPRADEQSAALELEPGRSAQDELHDEGVSQAAGSAMSPTVPESEGSAAPAPTSSSPGQPAAALDSERDAAGGGAGSSSPASEAPPVEPASAVATAGPLEPREAGVGSGAPDVPERAVADASGRSIEDVLAQERGHVPSVERAQVVGEVRHPRREERVVLSGGPLPSTGNSGGGSDEDRRGRQTDLRRIPASPASVKEMANEERRREKASTRVVVGKAPGPVRAPVPVVDPNAARGRRGNIKKKEVLQRRDIGADGEMPYRKQRRAAVKKEKFKTRLTTPRAIKRVIKIEDVISVGDLSHRMGVKAPAVIKKLMGMGVLATINQTIDHETAALIASEFEYEVENVAFDEVALLKMAVDTPEELVSRPPVVTVMGHVDHGKTTLLDAIRHTDVASREAGGITQHIGAYTVETQGGRVVFLDTPGHEAFTAMRARGAQVTDIVVLVVAADDGVMPQTLEALRHAQEAKVPIIVAVNKIDKPGANPDRIRQMLAEHNLVPEDWGGQTIYAHVSAKEKRGVKELLELILLQAEVLELRANPNRAARAVVVEAQLDRGRGPVATVLVTSGTLRAGDIVVVGAEHGKVRAMIDDHGRVAKEAGPAIPVEIIGLSGVPVAGDELAVVESLDLARQIAENRAARGREKSMAKSSKVTLEDLFSQMQKDEVKELKIVLKVDVQGSLEAIEQSIKGLSTEKVQTHVLHSGVGAISESDVMLASTSGALVVGFNVKPDPKAAALAEQDGVEVRLYNVIYDATDDIRKAMHGMLAPVFKEKVLGHAEVRNLFTLPKAGLVIGAMVTDGKIVRGSMIRLSRGGKQIWEGKLASLRRFKDDVREVEKGYECGIGIEGFSDIQVGDVIEVHVSEEVRASL